MSETKDKQDRMIELLEEMLKWTKVTSIPHVKKLLLEILPNDKEKIAYHYSDGCGSKTVAKFAGVGYATVTKWWKVWAKAGIADMMSVKGGERARRIFSLEDFGIKVPPLKEVKHKIEEAEAPTDLGKPVEAGSVQEEMLEEEEGKKHDR